MILRKVNGIMMAFPDKENEIPVHPISTVTPLPNYTLYLTFANGEHKLYDVKPLFTHAKLKRVFLPLKDNKKLFDKVKVICNGCAIAWNSEIDLDGEGVYDESIRLDQYIASKTTNGDGKTVNKPTTSRTKKALVKA